jgi:hypothetical protein
VIALKGLDVRCWRCGETDLRCIDITPTPPSRQRCAPLVPALLASPAVREAHSGDEAVVGGQGVADQAREPVQRVEIEDIGWGQRQVAAGKKAKPDGAT